jgi:hypothetical protein
MWRRPAPGAPEVPASLSLADRIRYHAVRWAPLLATALVTYALFPAPVGVVAPMQGVGQAAGRTVVAPFDFLVRKTTEEIAREGESRALTAQPVYRFSATAYDRRSRWAGRSSPTRAGERAGRRHGARGGSRAGSTLGPEESDYLPIPAAVGSSRSW